MSFVGVTIASDGKHRKFRGSIGIRFELDARVRQDRDMIQIVDMLQARDDPALLGI